MANLLDKLKNTGKAIVASALIAGASGCASTLTPANRALREMPDVINGTARLDKYEIKGAKKLIVHIRQFHYDFNYPDLASLSENSEDLEEYVSLLRDTALCQRDIAEALDHLKSEVGVNELFAEGYYYGIGEIDEETASYYANDTLDDLISKGYTNHIDKELYMYVPGAELLMAGYDGTKLRGIEDLTLNKEANEKHGSVRGYWIHEAREDYALEKISESKEPVVYLILGGAHALGGKESSPRYKKLGRILLKDNIAAWNEKNPDKKYSLLEVTPENYNIK